jgi:hypothetical protein
LHTAFAATDVGEIDLFIPDGIGRRTPDTETVALVYRRLLG